MLNSLGIKEYLGGILIGEPIGQKPDSFGDIRPLVTPNNLLNMYYSTKYFEISKYFEFVNENDETLYPDIIVNYTFEDYIYGNDSILEYALEYKN